MTQRLKRWSIGVVGAMALLAGLAAAQDGVLDRANGNEPDTLDPQKYELLSENNVLRDLFEGLTTQGPNNEIVAGQAESWSASEDGTVWTFKLRDGLKWSDGTPLVAADFVAGARRIADPKTGAKMPDGIFKVVNGRDILEGRKPVEDLGVAAPDDRTVVITLVNRSPLVPDMVATTPFSPVPRHVYERVGEDWVKPGNMVTNGAYVLTVWDPATQVRAKKNLHYRAADTVAIEEVAWYPSDDQEMALKRFRAREIDFVPGVPASKIPWAQSEMPDALQVSPVVQIRYLEFNHARPVMQDKRVRRALALLIDRETIAEKLMYGAATPAYGFTPRAIEGYTGVEFDFKGRDRASRVEEAKRLLAEAGYNAGNPLSIELRTMSDSWARPVAVAIIAMWKEAGVRATLKSEEGKTHFAAMGEGDFDIAMAGWFGTDDPETFMWLYQEGGGINESRYANPAFDAVRLDAEQTMERAARYARFADAERILLDDAATIPIFWTIQPVLVSPEIKGFGATPRGITRSRYGSFGR